MNELDALVNIDFKSRLPKAESQSLRIIRLGTSGALQADIPLDSHVVATFGIGLDNLMHFYHLENNAEESFILSAFHRHSLLPDELTKPYIAQASIKLLNRFMQGFEQGITLTCPGFYAPQDRMVRLPLHFPGLIDNFSSFQEGIHRICNYEMETAAFYGLGRVSGHHCLSLSTIINNRRTKECSKNSERAVIMMIEKSLEIISQI